MRLVFPVLPWSESRFFVWFPFGAKLVFVVFVACECARVDLAGCVAVLGGPMVDFLVLFINVRDPPREKILQKSSGKVWSLCFIALLLHPHSRENGASGMMETWRYPWVGDEVGWAKR